MSGGWKYIGTFELEEADESEEPTNAEELRAYIEQNANLVFNIGTIIEDRGVLDTEDEIEYAEREYALWRYLYDNLDPLYERVGPIIDSVEDAVLGERGDES